MKENFAEGTSRSSNRIEIDCFAHTIDSRIFPSKYRFYGRSVNIRTKAAEEGSGAAPSDRCAVRAGPVPRSGRSTAPSCRRRAGGGLDGAGAFGAPWPQGRTVGTFIYSPCFVPRKGPKRRRRTRCFVSAVFLTEYLYSICKHAAV